MDTITEEIKTLNKTYYMCKDQFVVRGNHTCEKNSIVERVRSIPDITPEEYAELIVDMRDKYKNIPYLIPSKKNVYAKIRENRGALNLNSIHAITTEPLRSIDGKPFLRRQFNLEVHGEYHLIIIWAVNENLFLLRYNTHTFIDGTFRSTPAPFIQCLIIMACDNGTDLYVPCMYSLMTSKSESLYCTVLHEVIVMLDYNWMPKIITLDFKISLINAVKHEFPESTSCSKKA
ncbi:hypothetical protein HZS_3165 [Henneguya salminicola]|nr:hypothetical protein HZS_3165 [Henneguya salminicola]